MDELRRLPISCRSALSGGLSDLRFLALDAITELDRAIELLIEQRAELDAEDPAASPEKEALTRGRHDYVRYLLANVYLLRGEAWLAGGDLQLASESFTVCLELVPDYADCHSGQFGTAVQMGQLEAAQELLASDPHVLAPILLMAIARVERGDWEEAEWNLRVLRRYQPRDPTILALSSLRSLGAVVLNASPDPERDLADARAQLGEAASVDANHQLVLAMQGRMLEYDEDDRAPEFYGLASRAPLRHSLELNGLIASSSLKLEIEEAFNRIADDVTAATAQAQRRLEERAVADETEPVVELDDLETAFVQGERVLVVSGTAHDDDAVEFVTVNGWQARLTARATEEGGSAEFVHLLRISEDETVVRVEASDPSGNVGSAEITFAPC